MTNNLIHPTAVISSEAIIGEGVEIGPYSVIEDYVEIGSGSKLGPHVFIGNYTRIGKNNRFFQFNSIGADPQDYSYKGEPTKLEIGDGNTFREFNTINRGTLKEEGLTKIGNSSLFMAYVHVGHDSIIGDSCTFANTCNFAGHVRIGDNVIVGGNSAISQFVTLGRGSYIGGASAVDRDIPAFCTAHGNRIKLKGINIIGMRRKNYSRQVISEVVDFYRCMEASGLSPKSFTDNKENMSVYLANEVVQEIIEGIRKTEVGIAPFLS